MPYNRIVSLLESKADYLLNHSCKTISKEAIRNPYLNYIEDTFVLSNRNPQPETKGGFKSLNFGKYEHGITPRKQDVYLAKEIGLA